jgi:hypothetical protein
MESKMTLTGASGRDYKSAKEVEKDWNDNKDFVVADIFSPWSGHYINKQDAPDTTINIRYDKNRKVWVVK